MSQLLKPGQTALTGAGQPCRVERFLGGGGQGEVYQVDWAGGKFALKWYFVETATAAQLTALKTLVQKGPPSGRFLWPLDVASSPGLPGYGYLMPLRQPRFRGITDLMRRRAEPLSRALATAGLHLAEGFLELHAKGLCYCDISFGNVFLDPASGDVAICDNDNVIVNGERPAILGTPDFMAPEVVRGEATPSLATDKFSLAVLLFYLFFMDHPLKGKKEAAIKCLDLPARTRLFGTEPLYIFDPKDDSNRPVPGLHDNPIAFEKVYPAPFKRLFEKAFTEGLRDCGHGRVTENEWRDAMVRLRDTILYCPGCQAENFYDGEALQARGGPGFCWSCGRGLILPFRIRLGKIVTMLNHDTRLYPHHVDDGRRFDFGQPAAQVVRHPSNPSVWGLKNLTATKWTSTMPDGTVRDVDPGRSATLTNGTRVNFGKVEGEIRY